MRLSLLLQSLQKVTEGTGCNRLGARIDVFVVLETLPKRKPYWLTKKNLEIPRKSRALVDLIQSYKARMHEPGFLKRTIITRNNQKRNE